MGRFFKIAAVTGVIFAVSQTLYFMRGYGFLDALVHGAIGGLFFGLFMASMLLLMTKLAKNTQSGNPSTFHKRTISLSGDVQEILDMCIEAISSLGRKYSIKACDKENGYLKVRLGAGWKTWGDIVEFKLESAGSDRTYNVNFSSRPQVSTTVIDHGTNLENVELIGAFLDKKSRCAENASDS